VPEPRPTTSRKAAPARAATRKVARYPQKLPPPVLVEVRRAGIVESRHRGHVVQVNPNGDLEMVIGDPEVEVTLRSAVKPFALVALVESGAADALRLSHEELAVMAASHTGEDRHVRTLQAVFRRAGVSQSLLACGPGAPSDRVTAQRLARDGEEPGPLRHQCSGFHAASLLLSRHADWSLEDYADFNHPSQKAVRETVARLFGTSVKALRTGIDDCGLATYAFPLADVARAFVLLADPVAATEDDPVKARSVPALTRIRDAMIAAPELVGGSDGPLDTILMRRKPGVLVSKGGAEGLRGIGLLAGARGSGRPAAGVAVRIDDGDGFARANRAVCVEALAQLDVLSARELQALAPQHRPITRAPDGSVAAEVIPSFQLAPISELV
jgi:L-asparaginase II